VIDIETTSEYPHAAQAVFAILRDIERYPAWQEDVLEARLGASSGEEIAAGAKVLQVRKVMGRRTEIELSVEEFVPDELITLQTAPGVTPGVRQSYRVTADGDGCRLDFRLQLDGVPRMAEHLAKAQLGHQVPKMLERLGALLPTS
jgi:hypothetical protein